MRALVLMLAGALAAGPAAAGPLSDLLMAPGLLAAAPDGEVVRYAHTRRLPAQGGAAGTDKGIAVPEAVGDGQAVLTAEGATLVLTLGEGGTMQEVARFPGAGPNPMLLFFLENVVRSMVIQTGGSPYYIRNRIKDAIVTSDRGADRDGRRIVVLHPFEADPHRARMGEFGALTLTLAYDPADPGRLVELLADTGTPASGYSERLTLIPEE
ncbi:MAG: hypothetical protein ACT4OK_16710 [Gemmobacter sp.]